MSESEYVPFEEFQLNVSVNCFVTQTIVVDDWDEERDGRLWIKAITINCNGTREDMTDKIMMMFYSLPRCNTQGIPRTSIRKMHLSGNLQPTQETRDICVFIAYECDPL